MAYHEDDEHVVDVPALLEEFKKSRVHNAKEIVANTKWNEEPLLSSLPTAQRVLRHAARAGSENGSEALDAIAQLSGGTASALAGAVDGRDSRGSTALMLACRWGQSKLAKELVSAGADANAIACYYEFGPSVDPATAAGHVDAGANGSRGAKAVAVDVRSTPELRSDTALSAAKRPPDGSAKQKNSHKQATGEATITGEGKEAKKLLYPSWGQLIVETPIHNAAEHGTSMLRALLSSSSASVNMAVSPDGYTPLHIAATTVKSGQTSAVQLLLERGACVNAKDAIGMTPLAWVCTSPRPPNLRPEAEEVAIALINGGAVVNGPVDVDGNTCLHGAAILGYAGVCAALVSQGADTEVPGEGGMTPLLAALSVSRAAAALALVRSGADVNKRRKEGRSTALHWAAGNGSDAVVAELLRAGANVNALDHHCVSPLLAAAGRGQLSTCRLLCRWGANDKLYNLDGHAPYSLARLKGYLPTANFLDMYRKHTKVYRIPLLMKRVQFLAAHPEVAAAVQSSKGARSTGGGRGGKSVSGGTVGMGSGSVRGAPSDAASFATPVTTPGGGGPVSHVGSTRATRG